MAKVELMLADREANRRQIEDVLKSARSETNARLKAERRRTAMANALESDARKVAAAIRKTVREQAASRNWIGGSGGRGAGWNDVPHDRDYEKSAGFIIKRPSARKADGRSSFHFKWSSRGFNGPDQRRARPYKVGEARQHIRYVIRIAAREVSLSGGLSSNISEDPDRLTAFFDIVEELESHDRINANVYCSIVVSLPHELDAEQRAELFSAICSVLGRYDLPYVGANHLPDPDGDSRNFHGHIVLSLRPFRIVSSGVYEFSDTKSSDLNDGSFIAAFRAETAELINAAMAGAGHERRFTALSDTDRGFEPRTKKSGKDSIGKKNAERKAAKLGQMRVELETRLEERDAIDALLERLIEFSKEPVIDFEARVTALGQSLVARMRAKYTSMTVRFDSAIAAQLSSRRAGLSDLGSSLATHKKNVVMAKYLQKRAIRLNARVLPQAMSTQPGARAQTTPVVTSASTPSAPQNYILPAQTVYIASPAVLENPEKALLSIAEASALHRPSLALELVDPVVATQNSVNDKLSVARAQPGDVIGDNPQTLKTESTTPAVVPAVNALPPVSAPTAAPAPIPRPLWISPDPRRDPARVAQIATCVRHIVSGILLPLVRRNNVLALDPACLSDPVLKTIDLLDEDADIQDALHKSWSMMKVQLAEALHAPGPSPFKPGNIPVVMRGSLTDDLERAYKFAANDADVSAIVAAAWRARASETEPSASTLDREARVSAPCPPLDPKQVFARSTPATTSVDAPLSPPSPPSPTTALLKEKVNDRIAYYALLSRVREHIIGVYQRGPEDAAQRLAAQPPSSVLHLSDVAMVHDNRKFEVLLHRNQADDLGCETFASDGLRRPGASDREARGRKIDGGDFLESASKPTPSVDRVAQVAEIPKGASGVAPPVSVPPLPPHAKTETSCAPEPPVGFDPLLTPRADDDTARLSEAKVANLFDPNQARADISVINKPAQSQIPVAALGETAALSKIDGHRHTEPSPLSPVKPQPTAAENEALKRSHEIWANLLKGIAINRVRVVKNLDETGSPRYTVPSINKATHDLLEAGRFTHRSKDVLRLIYEKQQFEIERVVQWITTDGRNPDLLVLRDNSATFGETSTEIRNLSQYWKTEKRVIDALKSEKRRRDILKTKQIEQALYLAESKEQSGFHDKIEKDQRNDEMLQRIMRDRSNGRSR